MFGLQSTSGQQQILAFCLSEASYSIAIVSNNKKLLFCERREFADKLPEFMAKAIADDVLTLHKLGGTCNVVLASGQYQLLQMDALDMPENEMAKALRWRLKGLVDYALNDVVIDVFPIPPHGVANQRKKVFVAVTPLSILKNRLAMFEAAYLDVSHVGIAELALRNIVALVPNETQTPVVVISFEEGVCQLQIFFNNELYLVRELNLSQKIIEQNGPEAQTILLEIQRSTDYCLSELKIPEPKKILFTPIFSNAGPLLDFLRQELNKEIVLLNLADYLEMETPLSPKVQQACFYSIGAALSFVDAEAVSS